MNGVHDLGGMQDFGPVVPEPDEPVFHAEWERRAFALTLAASAPGGWNIDTSRHARESLPPVQYLSSTYYQIWYAGIVNLLRENGLIRDEELQSGEVAGNPKPVARILKAADVDAAMGKGGPADRAADQPAAFAIGDRVRARNIHPKGHTRLPRYARGKTGEIARVHGCHVFPDANAHGLGERPQWLYSVRFSARELWGEEAAGRDSVHIDLWEPYLDRV